MGPLASRCLVAGLTVVALSCCKTGPEGQQAPPQVETSDLRCETDRDCLVSCYKGEHCCGDPCECGVLRNRKSEDALRAWRDDHCKDFECPQADCDVPQYDYAPYCDNGRCQVDKTPWVPDYKK